MATTHMSSTLIAATQIAAGASTISAQRTLGSGVLCEAQGDFIVQAITDGQELDFNIIYRALVEQVVSALHLPPFMLGLQWSTMERRAPKVAATRGTELSGQLQNPG